jgi:pimeloyl-ACP methyl ester carboxylesterase
MSRWSVAIRFIGIAAAISFAIGALNAQSAGPGRAPDPGFGLQEARSVVVNGTELKYVERGSGSPVVLVHGQASDLRVWQALIEEASGKYRVIAYSRRYFFPNPSSQTLPRFQAPTDAGDLIAFIEALKVAPVHLVGHSAGGHAALIVAVERPDLVRSLVLAEGGFLEVPGASNAGAAASRNARVLLEAGQDEQALRTFIDATSGAGAFDRMPEADRQRIRDNRMALGLPLSPPPSCKQVGAVAKPVMIVEGDSSPAFLRALMKGVADCLPSAQRITIPNASHAMFLDNPKAFNTSVIQFIAENDR